MFYGQCWACGERWSLGTASTCKCPPMPDYKFNIENAPIKYQLGKAVSVDWVMRITPDRKIEVAENVEVTEAAKQVLQAMGNLLQENKKPWVGLTDEDKQVAFDDTQEGGGFWEFADAIEAKLKEKNK